jgi:hypothetical protein
MVWGLDEFGTAERASGSIVPTDRLGPVVLAGAGQIDAPVGNAIGHGFDGDQAVVDVFQVCASA